MSEEHVPYGNDVVATPAAVGAAGSVSTAPAQKSGGMFGRRAPWERPNLWGMNNAQAAWEMALWLAGKTRKDVAEACGVELATVNAWARGKVRPSTDSLCKAAEVLGSTPTDLLGWCAHAEVGLRDAFEAGVRCTSNSPLRTVEGRLQAVRALAAEELETVDLWCVLGGVMTELALRRIEGREKELRALAQDGR